MTLSVIIPVYKTEKTIDRCIESVLSQNIDDMEVILVDDGSPDECPSICDKWAKKDIRIKVIHKKNGGLSDARNAGIDIAKGNYITFVDSDDYLNENIYSKMLAILNNNKEIDFIEFSVNCIGWDKIDIQYSDYVYSDVRDYWRKTKAWNHAYSWNKIYKKIIFKGLRFPKGKFYEDLWIFPLILKQCSTVATSSVIGYNYCVNTEGISALPDSENLKQCLAAEQNAAKVMNAHWYFPSEWNLYICMLYRQVDIYRMSGEIILKWPFVRLICWIHKKTKGRNKVAHTL